MRNLDYLMGEIEMLAKKYNYGVLMIDDDSFTIKADYVAEFCERYTRIDRPFVTQTRADFIVRHPELVKELKKAGLWMFLIGFESGNQRILDLYCKDATVKTNLEAARICHENGIKIWANFILGAPTETKDEVMDTLEMLRKIKPTHYSPSFYTPIIGTHLYDYCKNEGLLLTDDPADIGSRSPPAPKIRGQDYQWLRKTLNHSLHKDWRYQARRVIGQVRRCLP